MGTAKHRLRIDGVPILDRIAAALERHVESIVLLGSGALPSGWEAATRLPDAVGADGPVAGVLAALRWAPRASWVITACDQPWVEPSAIGWLLDQRAPGCAAVLPRKGDERLEPLLAVYEPGALPALERMVRSGESRLHRLADHAPVATPRLPRELISSWADVDVPADLPDTKL
jgi:molybdopterin-guanine dinucleotide biosynthesis protein A